MIGSRFLLRRHYHATAFAQTYTSVPVAGTAAPKEHFVAIFEEGACLAARERKRVARIRAHLEQASTCGPLGTRKRAGSDQISRAQVAAVHRVMRHHLENCPVEIPRARLSERARRNAVAAHLLRGERDAKLNVDSASRAIHRAVEVRQRKRVACSARVSRSAKRHQRVERQHPRRYARGKAFTEKRPEWLVFPSLNIAC